MQLPDVILEERAQWLHELRNSINTTVMSIHVLRRYLEAGEIEPAMKFLADAEAACDSSRLLVGRKAP